MGRRGHKKQKEFKRAVSEHRSLRMKDKNQDFLFFSQKVDAVRQARQEKQGVEGEEKPRTSQYDDIIKENPLFERFYRVKRVFFSH